MFVIHLTFPTLQAYAVHRMYQSLMEDTSQLGVLQAGIWCIGEYVIA